MATDPGIIKEFLVALGFKVDDKKLKAFTQGIDKATKFVGKLAFGVEAMATAVETAVVKVSERFEDLYYSSQRMSDSAENIRGVTFAIGQLGGTAQGGLQALENLGEFFRSNPGGERFVQGLGVQTRNANGELRGMTEILKDLEPVLRSMPYYRAKVVAGVLGIDPKTLQALLRDTGEAEARFHQLAQRMGVNLDEAAKASRDFMNSLRELMAVITLTFDRIVLRIQPFVGRVVKGLEDLDASTQGWSTALIALSGILLPLLAVLDPIWVILLGLALLMAQMDWSGLSPQIAEVSSAFADLKEALGEVWSIFQPFWEWLTRHASGGVMKAFGLTLSFLAFNLRLMADVIRMVVDLLTGNWSKAWADAGKLARDTINGIVDLARKGAAVLSAFWHGTQPPAASAAAAPAPGSAATSAEQPQPGRGGPIGLRNNNPGNLRTGPGGAFGHYATPLAGLTAMAKNLQAYARHGFNTVAAIINRWAPPSDHNDTEAYIRDVAKQLGVSARQQLDLKDPDTLVKLMNAITQHENGRNPYSPGLVSSAASAALGRPVAIQQTNTYHIDGSKDPHATAKAVGAEQARVNDAMVRNLKVAAS